MKKEIPIVFPTDENGMTGRECPSCKGYFKVKFGTGLPTSHCICPYCGEKSEHDKFFTQAQIEYAQSVAVKEVLGPELKKLERSFKELERSTRGGFIQFKVKTSGFNFPLRYYQEKELETHITCDNCGHALVIFNKSMDVAKKRLVLIDSLDESDVSLKDAILEDSLSGGVSAFDGFGKALRNKYPDKLSLRPRNLFQNVVALSDCLTNTCGKSLSDLIGKSEFEFLNKWFQIRHIYEHNMGVVDDDFVKKVPGSNHLKGKKYPLERKEIEKFLNELSKTGNVLMKFLEKV